MHIFLNIITGLLPVFLFLLMLIYMDGYKLVRVRNVLTTLFAGCISALAAYFINQFLYNNSSVDFNDYTRYIAPAVEEISKGIFIVYLVTKRKTGFLIDAAIYGFAIGAGFGLIENIFYLSIFTNGDFVFWIVRGFGTAVMHGSSTAVLAIISKYISDKFETVRLIIFFPGFIAAYFIHSAFNHFLFFPMLQTALQLIISPVIIFIVLRKGEELLREWMETGLDSDVNLLEIINEGKTMDSHIGNYLLSLKNKFEGTVLVDMLCLLKLYLELSSKVKGILLQREAGLNPKPDDEIYSKFDEIKYLEKSIGKTGRLAVMPLLHTKTKELWQLYMLGFH